MQGATWIDLLQKIPRQQHDNLMLLTTIGTEIAITSILLTEPEYVVLRGRVAGTTDAGRVMFVPYDQINYLGFQKLTKEAELYAMFGVEPPVKEASLAAAEPESAAAAVPGGVDTIQPTAPTGEAPKAEEPAAPSAKVVLLERLRARLANKAASN